MTKSNQRIVSSINEINVISSHAASESQTVSAATEEQSASMEEVASASQGLSKMAEKLRDNIAKFKI